MDIYEFRQAIVFPAKLNRPLAKLDKAVKVADTSDQGKAESKAISAAAVRFGKDTESLHEADGVLDKDALHGNLSVFGAPVLLMDASLNAFLAGWNWDAGRKPQIPGIRFQQGIWQNMSMGFFKQPEIVLLPIGKGQRDDLSIFEVYQHLCFQCMTPFLPGIVPSLLFWGRSIGDSVASTRITSYSISLFSGALRPGNENVPSWINVFLPT